MSFFERGQATKPNGNKHIQNAWKPSSPQPSTNDPKPKKKVKSPPNAFRLPAWPPQGHLKHKPPPLPKKKHITPKDPVPLPIQKVPSPTPPEKKMPMPPPPKNLPPSKPPPPVKQKPKRKKSSDSSDSSEYEYEDAYEYDYDSSEGENENEKHTKKPPPVAPKDKHALPPLPSNKPNRVAGESTRNTPKKPIPPLPSKKKTAVSDAFDSTDDIPDLGPAPAPPPKLKSRIMRKKELEGIPPLPGEKPGSKKSTLRGSKVAHSHFEGMFTPRSKPRDKIVSIVPDNAKKRPLVTREMVPSPFPMFKLKKEKAERKTYVPKGAKASAYYKKKHTTQFIPFSIGEETASAAPQIIPSPLVQLPQLTKMPAKLQSANKGISLESFYSGKQEGNNVFSAPADLKKSKKKVRRRVRKKEDLLVTGENNDSWTKLGVSAPPPLRPTTLDEVPTIHVPKSHIDIDASDI